MGATERAGALLARWGEDLDPDTRASLTKTLRDKKINRTAEDTAFDYYGQLKADKMTPTEINDEINNIEDPDLKSATRSKARAYIQQDKYDRAAWVQGETIDRVGQMEALTGNLVAQQALLDNYRVTDVSTRKVHTQMQAYMARAKGAEGLRPTTDPASYASATDDIIDGRITKEEDIDETYGVNIEKQDREDLKKALGAAQTAQKRSLKTAYTEAMGIKGGAEASLTKTKKTDYGEFLKWAEAMTKESNRAQEPGYLQELADTWALEGERKRQLTPGYGKDTTFGKTIRSGTADKFLPETPAPEVVSEINTMWDANPTVKDAWIKAYNGDEELAIRAFYKKLRLIELGAKK